MTTNQAIKWAGDLAGDIEAGCQMPPEKEEGVAIRIIIKALRAAQKRERQYRKAIMWACGANGEFAPRPEGAGMYWWRVELMTRAGISLQEWNKEAMKKPIKKPFSFSDCKKKGVRQ